MSLSHNAFQYSSPSVDQIEDMKQARNAVAECAGILELVLPDGPDKTYTIRKLREVGMWANVAITKMPDGAPRK